MQTRTADTMKRMAREYWSEVDIQSYKDRGYYAVYIMDSYHRGLKLTDQRLFTPDHTVYCYALWRGRWQQVRFGGGTGRLSNGKPYWVGQAIFADGTAETLDLADFRTEQEMLSMKQMETFTRYLLVEAGAGI